MVTHPSIRHRRQRANDAVPRSILPYGLGLAALVALLVYFAYEPQPATVRLAAIVVIVTAALPLMRWHFLRSETLPMFELICLSYGVQFGISAFLQSNSIWIIGTYIALPWEALATALLYVEVGLVAFILGYALTTLNPSVQRLRPINLPLDPVRGKRYIIIALVLGGLLNVASQVGLSVGNLGALLYVGTLQFNVALTLWVFSYYERPGSRLEGVLLAMVLLLGIGVGILGGMLETALVPIVVYLAARWTATKRLPWAWMIVGFVGFLILNQAKFEYRAATWDRVESLGVTERAELWSTLAQGSVQRYTDPTYQVGASELVRNNLARFDLIHKFTWVVTQTPRYVPYFEGETYGYLFVAWIPRLLWPDKPVASDATHQIDLVYNLKFEQQVDSTSIGIGQLPEAFANFGRVGIIIGMAVQGSFLALANVLFNHPRSEGGRAIYLNIMVYFLNGIGTSTAIMFGALFQQLIANAFLLRLFAASGWRQPSPDSTPKRHRTPL